jgi:nucleolar complex protein 3
MVFADILPDYRIRLPTEKEKEMKVSKEVAQQRAFEAAMLGGYQRFLQASNMLCEM